MKITLKRKDAARLNAHQHAEQSPSGVVRIVVSRLRRLNAETPFGASRGLAFRA